MGRNQTVLFVCEKRGGQFIPAAAEISGATAQMGVDYPRHVTIALMGRETRADAESLARKTGCDLIAVEHESLRHPNPPAAAEAVLGILGQNPIDLICLPHSPRNCQTAAIVSQAIGAACITGADSIRTSDDKIVFGRALFNGKADMTVDSRTRQTVLTLSAGAFSDWGEAPKKPRAGKVSTWNFRPATVSFQPRALIETAEKDSRLQEADVIVSIGKGLGDAKHLPLVRQFAALLQNAAVGGSRTACDLGWLPYSCQIGETGRQVAPKLYLALGISGARQHLAGIKNAQSVIAVNTDPAAAIFSVADIGIIEDMNTFLQMILEKVTEEKTGRSPGG